MLSADAIFSEIIDMILGHMLCTPAGQTIEPQLITTNWKTEWKMHPDFTIDRTSGRNQDVQYVKVIRYDDFGEYIEYHSITRAVLDSTCLRTCPEMGASGARLLYGCNTFAFSMLNRHPKNCPPCAIWRGNVVTKIYQECPHKPNMNSRSILDAIDHIRDGHKVIKDDHLRIVVDHLHPWVYYDPFLRFLHTIEPRNAAFIKTLSFGGVVQRHNQCSSNSCQKRGEQLIDDLVASLRLYIIFIRKFCINLEKLIIVAWDDYRVRLCRQHDHRDESLPKSMKQAFLPFLENDVRSIRSLRELEVIIKEEKKGETDEFEFAQETMNWFKDRASKRAARKRELNAMRATAKPAQEKAQLLRQKLKHLAARLGSTMSQEMAQLLQERSEIVTELCRNCEHCGEEHLSLECYNLCNFCGDTGHWRDTCQKLAAAELELDLARLMSDKEEEAGFEEIGRGLESAGEPDSGYQTISGEDSIEEGKDGDSEE